MSKDEKKRRTPRNEPQISASAEAATKLANEVLKEQLEAYTSTDSIQDFLAGVVGGFLFAHKRPIEPFIEKVKEIMVAFGGASEECEDLLDTLREKRESEETKH